MYSALLREKFKIEAFRPGQQEAIELLLKKNRLLAIQPTGYGKSLLYQFPSCLLEGITLVISPLLALMRDQIEQLKSRFQIAAASLNSDQTEAENIEAMRQILSNEIKILFISPEQLDHVDRFDFFLKLPISLFVIDEAHCISTWGHDFRPSYRQILKFCQVLKKKRPEMKILGLTATADARVEKDIADQLSSIDEPIVVWREKMDRPNIHLSVFPVKGIASKLILCQNLLKELKGHGLIYCSTRENTELVAEYLSKEGISIVAYHAGLESEEKRGIQSAFAQNQYQVICATTALGMGIDKKDIRFIIHFDVPGSITAYYQEVGRAGRDGARAEGLLLYDQDDRNVQDYFIESSLPKAEDFALILETIKKSEEPAYLSLIKRLTGLHPTRVTVILAELIDQGFVEKVSVKGRQIYQLLSQENKLDLSRYLTQHLVKCQELDKILNYAEEKTDCRMALLRKALGDDEATACGRCDICEKRRADPFIDKGEALLWLSQRPVPIAGAKTDKISSGMSLFDGKLRTPPFQSFMKGRATSDKVDGEILELLVKEAKTFDVTLGAIVALPSNTWRAKEAYAKALAEKLKIPCLSTLLFWEKAPEKRQGELLNNDQRHFNVHEKMGIHFESAIPKGAILLFDDYIGSGATIKEAARVLRKKTDEPLIPLTIAALKWRLGKAGFI